VGRVSKPTQNRKRTRRAFLPEKKRVIHEHTANDGGCVRCSTPKGPINKKGGTSLQKKKITQKKTEETRSKKTTPGRAFVRDAVSISWEKKKTVTTARGQSAHGVGGGNLQDRQKKWNFNSMEKGGKRPLHTGRKIVSSPKSNEGSPKREERHLAKKGVRCAAEAPTPLRLGT